MVALLLVFKGTSILFSIVAALIYIPANSIGSEHRGPWHFAWG